MPARFVGKLAEDGARGATAGVLEIYRIHQVHCQGNAVNHHKRPFAHLVVGAALLEVQRQQHHDDVEGAGVHDCRRVEGQSALKGIH